MRCKCGELLSTYDMQIKRRIVLETGQVIEIHEDLCGKCRKSWDDIINDDEEIEELED